MREGRPNLPAIFCGIVFFFISLLFQTHGISGGDSGDLVSAAVTGGVPHPPGYPLYTFLGYIVSRLSVFTPAWRVGLLSSFFHAASITLLFLITHLLTRSRIAALFSVSIVIGTYIFFYYSITPEVFALLNFFLLLILYTFFLWYEKKNTVYLYLAIFFFFLSLSHHHMILFAVPAFIVGIAMVRKHNNVRKKLSVFVLLFLFLAGLLPYVYVPFASRNNSIIYWNNPETLRGFMRLVTRADYGTFQSSGVYGELPIQRFLSVKAYVQFVLSDFRLVGVILCVVGFWQLWKKRKWYAVVLGVALIFLGPIFFFYASFPIVNNFTLGIYERFLLPSYVLLAIFIGSSFPPILLIVERIIYISVRHVSLRRISVLIVVCVIFLYPFRLIYHTLSVTQGLSVDMTANKLGEDILSQTKHNAIVILTGDTALFITQYMRYVLNFRIDTKVLHASGLLSDEYPGVVHSVFPDLVIPKHRGAQFLQDFIKENKESFPIYVNEIQPIPDGMYWVPKGLLYELTEEKDLPSRDQLATESAVLFSLYQNPLNGVLKTYKHFMLTDIQETYADAAQRMGNFFMKATKLDEAEKYFLLARDISEESMLGDIYLNLGVVYFLQDKCDAALDALHRSRDSHEDKDNATVTVYEIATYKECFKDNKKAEEIKKQYDDLEKPGKTLKQWQ